MRIVTLEDARDLYLKIIQRGIGFIFSKFTFSNKRRTRSSFNEIKTNSSNFWMIPDVKKRWNHIITGSEEVNYEKYVSSKYAGFRNIKMLSIGSGVCSHELEFARLNSEWEITCIDFSEKLLRVADKISKSEGLKNIKFITEDIYKHRLTANCYDIVLFHSSLHHFRSMDGFISKIKDSLTSNGKLIINEYVGAKRLQYNKLQLIEINECLKFISKEYRKLYLSNMYKNKYYGSGILRMIIADPSECIESDRILPVIHSKFMIVEEKGYGGNLLMPALKDISHHFIEANEAQKEQLKKMFDYEDSYLKNHRSDFVFGIYEKSS